MAISDYLDVTTNGWNHILINKTLFKFSLFVMGGLLLAPIIRLNVHLIDKKGDLEHRDGEWSGYLLSAESEETVCMVDMLGLEAFLLFGFIAGCVDGVWLQWESELVEAMSSDTYRLSWRIYPSSLLALFILTCELFDTSLLIVRAKSCADETKTLVIAFLVAPTALCCCLCLFCCSFGAWLRRTMKKKVKAEENADSLGPYVMIHSTEVVSTNAKPGIDHVACRTLDIGAVATVNKTAKDDKNQNVWGRITDNAKGSNEWIRLQDIESGLLSAVRAINDAGRDSLPDSGSGTYFCGGHWLLSGETTLMGPHYSYANTCEPGGKQCVHCGALQVKIAKRADESHANRVKKPDHVLPESCLDNVVPPEHKTEPIQNVEVARYGR